MLTEQVTTSLSWVRQQSKTEHQSRGASSGTLCAVRGGQQRRHGGVEPMRSSRSHKYLETPSDDDARTIYSTASKPVSWRKWKAKTEACLIDLLVNGRPAGAQQTNYIPPGRLPIGHGSKTPSPGLKSLASFPRIGGLMADSGTSRMYEIFRVAGSSS